MMRRILSSAPCALAFRCPVRPACTLSGRSAAALSRLPGRHARAEREFSLRSTSADELIITQPDDWHLHVRDGPGLTSVVPMTASTFSRAIIMPNLVPPVTTVDMALDYKKRIMAAVPEGSKFQPLMTLYLTDKTTPEDVFRAKEGGVVAFKLYPAGATTNSDAGVTDIAGRDEVFKAMNEAGLVLCVHGEVVDPVIDMFDREGVFIDTVLKPLLDRVPDLRVVMEHITTKNAVDFVRSAGPKVAASITPQHMLLNRNALLVGGIRPHNYCLPILKRELHREAVAGAATSGEPSFFLGTDSAPHPKGAKESACGCAGIFSAPHALPLYAKAFEAAGVLDRLEAFASHHGADFYGMPRNTGRVRLVRKPWTVPAEHEFGDATVVPMMAGEELEWAVDEVTWGTWGA
ncbi:unnamed protein product [Pedinophyceae sp. YPF-701]|nr:unnamed protein product [Pedinophyceae sp. YPF-701]